MNNVKAKFAYYVESMDDPEWKPEPSYFILESDHPMLPVHGNVGGDQLLAAGVGLPMTPTFETWVKMGRPVFRGRPETDSCQTPGCENEPIVDDYGVVLCQSCLDASPEAEAYLRRQANHEAARS